MEMDFDSLNLAPGEDTIDKGIKLERLSIWNIIRQDDCLDSFKTDPNII